MGIVRHLFVCSVLIILTIGLSGLLYADNISNQTNICSNDIMISDDISATKKCIEKLDKSLADTEAALVQATDILENKQRYSVFEEHTKAALAWQLVASKQMLYLVWVLVCFSLIMSLLHFIFSYKLGKVGDNAELVADARQMKIQITSSVIGVTLLGLSMVFIYLFLDRVYKLDLNMIKPIIGQ